MQPAVEIAGEQSLTFHWMIHEDHVPQKDAFRLLLLPTDQAPWFWVSSIKVDGEEQLLHTEGGQTIEQSGAQHTMGKYFVPRGGGQISITVRNATTDPKRVGAVLL